MATLSKRRRRLLDVYLRALADELGLRDWTIELMHAAPEEGTAFAASDSNYGRRVLKVWFREDFRKSNPEEQRMVCVHELLHAHIEATDWYLLKTLPGMIGQAAWVPIREHLREQRELAVDALATSIAKHYPLPDWHAPDG
jgi:hypothetical protein